jgi:hypothetical protein
MALPTTRHPEEALAERPAPRHPQIVTYPTIVYQKIDSPPGYLEIPVASEADVLAIEGGPIFLTAANALQYQPPPEQPMPWVERTGNVEQFVIGRSQFGREVPKPVARDITAPNTYVRQGVPDAPVDPPVDPPARTQGGSAPSHPIAGAPADPNAPAPAHPIAGDPGKPTDPAPKSTKTT